MSFAEAIRDIRQKCFLSQDAFANALGVSLSTVNRWEKGKSVPNCITMQKVVSFCKEREIDYALADEAWKENKNGIHSH